ncbi:MAG: amidohydrolase, partial [Mycobacteriaceae bacterium]|nr:amidohydrolase [Mycobacteriaceae bacterium]
MTALAEHMDRLRLVDHHVHGCWIDAPDRRRFENALNEANTEPIADFDSAFDTQLGFAVRAHCAPLLGLAAHAEPDEYWRRRTEFSEVELARVFLPAAGVSDWLVDTGVGADPPVASLAPADSPVASLAPADVDRMAGFAAGRAHEVIRLEQIAEHAAADTGDYIDAFDHRLQRRA